MKLQQYKTIAPTINAEITAVLEKHGFKVTNLRAGIEEATGGLSLTIKASDTNLVNASGEKTTGEAERFRQMAQYVGCKAEWLGQEFPMAGKTYRLDGMRNTRGAKSMMVSAGGKTFIATPDQVAAAFALKDVRAKAAL